MNGVPADGNANGTRRRENDLYLFRTPSLPGRCTTYGNANRTTQKRCKSVTRSEIAKLKFKIDGMYDMFRAWKTFVGTALEHADLT
jgi:hypothetical protein